MKRQDFLPPFNNASIPVHWLSAVSGIHPHFPERCPCPVVQTQDQSNLCYLRLPSSVATVLPQRDWALTTIQPTKGINLMLDNRNANGLAQRCQFASRRGGLWIACHFEMLTHLLCVAYRRDVEVFDIRDCCVLDEWTQICSNPFGITLILFPASYGMQKKVGIF